MNPAPKSLPLLTLALLAACGPGEPRVVIADRIESEAIPGRLNGVELLNVGPGPAQFEVCAMPQDEAAPACPCAYAEAEGSIAEGERLVVSEYFISSELAVCATPL